MGCDIYPFVEYVAFTGHDDQPYWQCIMQGFGNRNYEWFSLLADCGRNEQPPLFPNRGLPEGKLSYTVEGVMWLTVTEDEELAKESGYCTPKDAESWRRYHHDGYRETRFKGRDENGNETERIHKQVMHPDLHSHSWLTCDELAQVIGHWIAGQHDYPYGVEWDAVLAAMRALEERGHKTRLIFAFDN